MIEPESQRIADSLREEILAGKFQPGTRIRQEDVASRFRASRSPVREAFRMLEAGGLITLIANTGAWVTELTFTECEEMYHIRERLEPLMLRLSIPHLNESHIEKLEWYLDSMENNSDIEKFLKLDREFHLLTYAGASTALLGDTVQRLWNTTQHYRRAYSTLLAEENFTSAHYEHHLLLSAIKRQDLDDGERVLYGHIRRTRLEVGRKPELLNLKN